MPRHTALGAQFPPAWHRPFLRYFDGEAGAAGAPPSTPPATPTTPPVAPVPTPPPAAANPTLPAPQPPAAPPAQPTPPVNYHGNPDDYVRELREEAKAHRLAAEKAANDFAAAQAERDALAAERDTLARERTLLLTAPKLGARADLLLDSSSFMKTFADVDLSNEEAVNKAITDALEKNSTFKAAPGLPAMSGGGHQGGANPATPVTLDSAVKKALGG